MTSERELKELFWRMVSEYAHDCKYAPSNVDYRKGKIAGFNSAMCLISISKDFFDLVSSTTFAVVVTHTH